MADEFPEELVKRCADIISAENDIAPPAAWDATIAVLREIGYTATPHDWQLMATVPKDGNDVLLCDARILSCMVVASWDDELGAKSAGYGWRQLDGSSSWHDGAWTHWMPLPPPPRRIEEARIGQRLAVLSEQGAYFTKRRLGVLSILKIADPRQRADEARTKALEEAEGIARKAAKRVSKQDGPEAMEEAIFIADAIRARITKKGKL